MSITPFPPLPSTSDPATFEQRMDAFLAALTQFVTEANALGVANTNYMRVVDLVDIAGASLATAYANGQTLDGVTITTGMRILRAVPGGDATNGIYTAPASGTASRASDSNASGFMPPGMLITVQRGTVYKSTLWQHTTAAGLTLGSTALTFTYQGEYIASSVLAGSAVALTTGVQTNITTISLPKGEWEVSGSLFSVSTGAITLSFAGANTVSATLPAGGVNNSLAGARFGGLAGSPDIQNTTQNFGPAKFSVASTTTVYLVAQVAGSGTLTAYGIIRARRIGFAP